MKQKGLLTAMKQQLGSMFLFSTIAVCAGCVSTNQNPAPTTLEKYQNAARYNTHSSSIAGIRYIGLRDAAISTGARAGLAWRAQQINCIVKNYERRLDIIYQFNALLLDKNVLPPVLLEGRFTLEQTSDEVIRISDRAFTIQSQARFVTLAPTWRDYLLMHYSEPDVPDRSLLPRTETEKEIWQQYIDQGWQIGLSQADIIFSENLGRLKRDFEGMVRYRSLLAQNMVSPPYVAEVNFGITGGEDQMAINDRVLRITALPKFNTLGNEWLAQVTPDER